MAERDGKVIGTVAGLRYGDRFSWLSMVLVAPAERGKGIGTQMLQEGLAMLREDCVRLDATALGRPIYARSGFVDEYGITRMSAAVNASAFADAPLRARLMRQEDLPSVFCYDQAVFGADRSRLLGKLFQHAPASAWIAGTLRDLQGYCFGRRGFLYQQLGPIVAQDQQVAADLISACLKSQGGKSFIVDSPDFHPVWLSWLRERGFSPARSFMRMRRGDNKFPGHPDRVYGITGPEFG